MSKPVEMPAPADCTYLLRTCNADMTSHGGFIWPESGYVAAPDWNPSRVCGGGLHGLLMGDGAAAHLSRDRDARWLVVATHREWVADIDRKAKAPCGWVVYCGDRAGAVADIIARGADPAKCVYATLTGGDDATLTGGDRATLTGGRYATLTGGRYATLTGGDDATLTGGDRATLTGGRYATLTGGDDATLTGGDRATLTGGDDATLTGGNRATLTGGNRATLTGGDDATLTGGDDATLTGGDRATLTGGDYATLTGGDDATLTGGDRATLTGGDRATLTGRYWDEQAGRSRTAFAECDGREVKPGVAYRVRDGRFVEAAP